MYNFSFYTSPLKSREHQNSTIELSTFLDWIKQGKYSKQIIALRKATGEQQDAIKAALPYATLSGIFAPGKRDAKSLQQHSGLMQIDIDAKDQTNFNINHVRELLRQDAFILSLFLSPRGLGLKAIIKIDATKHKPSFLALESYFKYKYNLVIDTACKDVCRAFFISADSKLYYNQESTVFIISEDTSSGKQIPFATDKKQQDIEALCKELEARNIDITNRKGYSEWRDIAFAIANGLGENGRSYFKRISAIASNYNQQKTDEQYTACCKNPNGSRKWESLFGIAKDFGIVISNNSSKITVEAKKETEQINPNPTNKNLPLIVQVENFLNERFEFRKNIVNEKTEYKAKGNDNLWMEANENVISRLLEHNYFKYSPSKTASLLDSDFVKFFNPITDYFNSLTYNPQTEPSYIDELCKKIKAKNQERFNKHFKKMLVRCVACSTVTEMTNNNFNKHVFVIINREQTIGKSSFCRWLCPPALNEYFVENIAMDKDGVIALATSFIINLDELASLSKYDVNQLKAKISMASINERLPYGRRRQFHPRRVNFLGSTNNDEFLNDDTGSARWLCFEIDSFEQGYWLKGSPNYIDINKVWCEAKYLFDNGFKYQLTLDEKRENEEINRDYEERSIEEEMITTYFAIDSKQEESNFMTANDILQYMVIHKGANTNKLSLKKIGSVLKKLGFVRGTKRLEKMFPVKGYYIKKV
ncbi:VapE domain-containing protein [Parasediminibacterium paludis]|uniref:VapE domain-containing protein n=1 Tax=Parasediminibacterium paludis TaxID=908966 RepID=A0ABV8PUF2_9BACT